MHLSSQHKWDNGYFNWISCIFDPVPEIFVVRGRLRAILSSRDALAEAREAAEGQRAAFGAT